VALSLVPGLAAAATISSFSVEASARMTLVGAIFVGPVGGDSVGSLNISYALDQLDDFPQQDGNASVTTNFTNDDATGFGLANLTSERGRFRGQGHWTLPR
jgi:hypothetical protein